MSAEGFICCQINHSSHLCLAKNVDLGIAKIIPRYDDKKLFHCAGNVGRQRQFSQLNNIP